jgi:hypothetical protein
MVGGRAGEQNQEGRLDAVRKKKEGRRTECRLLRDWRRDEARAGKKKKCVLLMLD